MTAKEFVAMVAALAKDGETVDGEEWEMPIDDSFDTLHSLIDKARDIRDGKRSRPTIANRPSV
jgi:hypothetical protein